VERQMRYSLFANLVALLILVADVGSYAATDTHKVDVGDWRTYRNEQYSLELRYPPDYAVVRPHNRLQRKRSPIPTLRGLAMG
ncbi:MAG TPA: hypothetical protein VF007_07095, partial [Stellaceae bacterium]